MKAAAAALVVCALLFSTSCLRRSSVPAALSDGEFWNLIAASSEPAGTFDLSDNFVSNEPRVAENARWLRPAGGVYIGVGPEQNFTYIARVRPSMAFIVDIRAENRNLHLLYKALFVLSQDRADFVSRLFSRPRPSGLGTNASVDELFGRYANVAASPEQYQTTLQRVRQQLVTTSGFPLTDGDLDWIARALKAFYTDGPDIQFWGSRPVDADAVRPSYRRLMTMRDFNGQTRSFLSSEAEFRFVRDLHARNMIVPVVGDFGGATAIKRVGDYVREHGGSVHAFYGSNVGVYLNSRQTVAFCRNLAGLPASSRAWFIDGEGVQPLSTKLAGCAR